MDEDEKQALQNAVKQLLIEAAGGGGGGTAATGQPDPLRLPEEEFHKYIEQLGNEGNGTEALKLMQARMAMMNQQTIRTGQQMLAENTEAIAKQQLGEEFTKWAGKVEEIGKTHGFDPHQFTSVKQWNDAIDLAKAKNIGEVIQEERKRYEQELRQSGKLIGEEFAGGSGEPEGGKVEAPAVGTPEFKNARDLEMDPVEYVKQVEALKPAQDALGNIQSGQVLLIEGDIESIKKTGRIVVERGKF